MSVDNNTLGTASSHVVTTEMTTEYSALREEIIARLSFQQQLIGFTFATATLLATAWGFSDKIGTEDVYIALTLAGATVSTCIVAIYLKQHLVIDLIATYLATKLSVPSVHQGAKDLYPFSGWHNHLGAYYGRRIFALLGYTEPSFPVLTGVLSSILTSYLLMQKPAGQLASLYLLFWCWNIGNILALIMLVLSGMWLRRQIAGRMAQSPR